MGAILAASFQDVSRALVLVVAVVALCGCGSSSDSASSTPRTPPPATTSNGAPVIDGIELRARAPRAHYHAHLTLLRDGNQVKVPAFIGIDLSTSASTGCTPMTPRGSMHIESPDTRTYTLGQFFDVWGQPLSATQAGG